VEGKKKYQYKVELGDLPPKGGKKKKIPHKKRKKKVVR